MNATTALEGLIARLHEQGRVRVWSLVITIFGDAIVPRGGQVPLQELQAIVERMRIEPGALRTALSRLAAEGWVERERDGRNSHYRLASQGRHAFDEATQRIYAAGPPKWDGGWTVAVALGDERDEDGRLAAAGFVARGSGVWFRPEIAGAARCELPAERFLVIDGRAAALPQYASLLWDAGEIASAFVEFAEALQPLSRALDDGGQLEPLDALVARTLLIHDWRRIVLRAPALPDALLPPNWPGREVRRMVKRLYARLAGPSEAWLNVAGLPPVADMAGFSARFGIVERIGAD